VREIRHKQKYLKYRAESDYYRERDAGKLPQELRKKISCS
jgi:predicted transcriptional regulator